MISINFRSSPENTKCLIKLENTFKYHENYSPNILKFQYEFGLKEIFFLITQLKSTTKLKNKNWNGLVY